MKLIKDIGMKFPTKTSKRKYIYGIYECPICKKHFEVMIRNVKNLSSTKCKSCAMSITSTVHGLEKHRLYAVWNQIIQRCTNPAHKDYQYYGERRIKVCERWLSIENFIEDMYSTYEEGLSIDRIDNNGNYEPLNCRWSTRAVQSRNTRKLKITNKSGYRGVYFHKATNKWASQVRVNNKCIHLGCFNIALEGAIAYDTYVIEHNLEHTINGVIK